MRPNETSDGPAIGHLVARLRLLVLALGERAEPPWWRTNLLSAAGRSFCERLFPRSALAAGLHAAGQAACAIHDQAIGRRGVLHLFRLPEAVEREVQERLADADGRQGLEALLGTSEEMMKRLAGMASVPKAGQVGPKRVATAQELSEPEAYARTAGVYLSAFRNGQKAFPYAEVSAP